MTICLGARADLMACLSTCLPASPKFHSHFSMPLLLQHPPPPASIPILDPVPPALSSALQPGSPKKPSSHTPASSPSPPALPLSHQVDPFSPDSPIKSAGIVSFPPDLFFVLRVVQLLRGLASGAPGGGGGMSREAGRGKGK